MKKKTKIFSKRIAMNKWGPSYLVGLGLVSGGLAGHYLGASFLMITFGLVGYLSLFDPHGIKARPKKKAHE